MPKELGQLHTVNFEHLVIGTQTNQMDASAELTEQLQRMVRQGNTFKVVGFDAALSTPAGTGGGQVSGGIRYYAPTRGRCAAYRSAFKAMKQMMHMQGVKMSDNKMYDFRVGFSDDTGVVQNNATLDGNFGLILNSAASPNRSVFGVHNEGVVPTYQGTTAGLFSEGFDTLLASGGSSTDFVLNEAIPFTGSSLTAETEFEFIPFTMSWAPNSTDIAIQFQWRPDPALYLAVMCGLFEVRYNQVELDTAASVLVNWSVTISGWSSMMSDGKRKKFKSKSKPRRRTSNRRSRSKK